MALNSLRRECGTAVLKGAQTKLYAIPKNEITAFPRTRAVIGSGTLAPGDTKILDEAFGLVQTVGLGYWREVDILVNTGQVKNVLEGDTGGKENKAMVELFVQGNGPKEKEFADMVAANDGCLILAMPTKDGHMQCVGNLDNPVFIEAYDGGSGPDRNGYLYTFMSSDPKTNPIINVTDFPLNLTPVAA